MTDALKKFWNKEANNYFHTIIENKWIRCVYFAWVRLGSVDSLNWTKWWNKISFSSIRKSWNFDFHFPHWFGRGLITSIFSLLDSHNKDFFLFVYEISSRFSNNIPIIRIRRHSSPATSDDGTNKFRFEISREQKKVSSLPYSKSEYTRVMAIC